MKKKLACIAMVRSSRSVTPANNFAAAAHVRMPVKPDGAAPNAVMTLITVKTKRIATEGGKQATPVIGSNTGQTIRMTRPGTGNNKQSATFGTGRFAILA